MEKQQIVSFIQTQLEQGRISSQELIAIAHNITQVSGPNGEAVVPKNANVSWNLVNTLYIVGAIIGIAGIGILTQQHWDEIGFGGRIGVTLGISLLTYLLAILLCKSKEPILSQIMFAISAPLAPIGVYILLQKLELDFSSLNQLITAIAFFVVFAVAQFIARTNLLVVILTAFASWAYYAALNYVLVATAYHGDLATWATIVLGVAYILIAFDLSKRSITATGVNVLYTLGTLAVLGAGITLGGNWDYIYILFVFAAFYGSVFVKSKPMLVLGAIFLMAHVLKLTYRFFLGSLGWPIALIIAGFCIIVIGYLTFQVNQRFLKK